MDVVRHSAPWMYLVSLLLDIKYDKLLLSTYLAIMLTDRFIQSNDLRTAP
jgi:hypothetical protein